MTRRAHLLSPWLRQQESVLVWAAAGVGKTLFTLTLALAIAGGGSVLGWTAEQPRRVLVVDGEMPEDDLRDRLVSLAGTVRGIDLQAARANLMIMARHGQHPDADFPDFGDPSQHDTILQRIRSYRPEVVILDNLSTLATIDDENGAAETQKLVKFLARLKQSRIATIAVHHSNKAGTDFRGSSMLATTFEAIIGLVRDKGAALLDPSGTAKFKLQWTKFRARRDATTTDRLVALEETGGDLEWTSEIPEEVVLAAIAALVRTGRYGTQKQVREALPEHLWPTKGSPPAPSWMSRQFALAHAKGIIDKNEVRMFFDAATGQPEEPDDDLHDDI
jgi:KaiC/GvpD/RAD55 family RecA-like ATPase